MVKTIDCSNCTEVYLLVDTCKMKLKDCQVTKLADPETSLNERSLPDLSLGRNDALYKVETSSDKDMNMEEDQGFGVATEEVWGMEHRQRQRW
uniref:Lysine-specific demethylase JMJ25-like isoform X4 n=1 Tax=Rhizophora mucronata TaxID=61149 RepID=A0A2P2N863_RHIMU